jgi:hypothetical protein
MNPSGRSYGKAVLRVLGLTLFSAIFLFAMGTDAQAQSMPTRHVHPEVTSGEAAPLSRLAANRSLRLNIALPCAMSQNWTVCCKSFTIPKAPRSISF